MRALLNKFRKSEDGASLVEYAVALIVVTIVGGTLIVGIAGNAEILTGNACDTLSDAVDATAGSATSC